MPSVPLPNPFPMEEVDRDSYPTSLLPLSIKQKTVINPLLFPASGHRLIQKTPLKLSPPPQYHNIVSHYHCPRLIPRPQTYSNVSLAHLFVLLRTLSNMEVVVAGMEKSQNNTIFCCRILDPIC